MPRTPSAPRRQTPTKKPRTATRRAPLLERADVRTILFDLANRLAPADVTSLLDAEADLRKRAAQLNGEGLGSLGDQLALAIDCLRDHVDGTCPQIPYFTISLLAAAVAYFADELDVIPDFLPNIGRLDDAVVMALAYELADDGLRRYCAFKGRDAGALRRPASTPASS